MHFRMGVIADSWLNGISCMTISADNSKMSHQLLKCQIADSLSRALLINCGCPERLHWLWLPWEINGVLTFESKSYFIYFHWNRVNETIQRTAERKSMKSHFLVILHWTKALCILISNQNPSRKGLTFIAGKMGFGENRTLFIEFSEKNKIKGFIHSSMCRERQNTEEKYKEE